MTNTSKPLTYKQALEKIKAECDRAKKGKASVEIVFFEIREIIENLAASEALAKEPEDWKTVFRRMWANNEFDDKFSKTLEFTYAFQKGFKAAQPVHSDSSGKETGMQWVKASERLPEKRHNYFVQFRIPENSVISSYLWNGTCLFDGQKFIDDINKVELSSGNTVEFWLDESVPPYKEEENKK